MKKIILIACALFLLKISQADAQVVMGKYTPTKVGTSAISRKQTVNQISTPRLNEQMVKELREGKIEIIRQVLSEIPIK